MSQYATINLSAAKNVTSLAVLLPGDALVLGPIQDFDGGITANAASIEVAGTGINTGRAAGNVNLQATGNTTVDAGATLETGLGTVSLAADVKADGTGNDGLGTLSVGPGALVTSTNAAASAVTLRGADINLDTSATPTFVGAQHLLSTTATKTLNGVHSPFHMACDSKGGLFTDIHLNFLTDMARRRFLESVGEQADALVVTGDIAESHSLGVMLQVIDALVQRPIYFVLGNHDFYRGSVAGTQSAVAEVVKGTRMVYLSQAGIVELTPNTALVGHDGWADGRLGDFDGSGVILNDFLLVVEQRVQYN
jgi:hypothetical protein